MSGIINPNFESADGALQHMGFNIYQDEMMPEHLGVFTKGQTLRNGVREVNAVGTIDWRTGRVAMSKGASADSIYVHPKRGALIREELSKKFLTKGVIAPLDNARKILNS